MLVKLEYQHSTVLFDDVIHVHRNRQRRILVLVRSLTPNKPLVIDLKGDREPLEKDGFFYSAAVYGGSHDFHNYHVRADALPSEQAGQGV